MPRSPSHAPAPRSHALWRKATVDKSCECSALWVSSANLCTFSGYDASDCQKSSGISALQPAPSRKRKASAVRAKLRTFWYTLTLMFPDTYSQQVRPTCALQNSLGNTL